MSCQCVVCQRPNDPLLMGMACREAIKPRCPFCGGTRSDGMVVHALDCEWCTLLQAVKDLASRRLASSEKHFDLRLEFVEKRLGLKHEKDHGTSENPDTQRSGSAVCLDLSTPDGWAEAVRLGAVAADSGEPHPDARAAEPAGSAYVGPDAARGGPERA